MPEISIKTSFGQIRFAYQSRDELETILGEIPSHIALVEQLTKDIPQRSERSPKPGLEGIYAFTPSGHVELYRSPRILNQKVALGLFCYSPDTVSEMEIEQVTGISKVVARVIGQTNNKKYYRSVNGTYSLTTEGIKLVTETILPKLQAAKSKVRTTDPEKNE
jgi:hypothetical protein